MRWDAHGLLQPDGPSAWMRAPSATLARTCPFSPAAANEDEIAGARFPSAPAHDPLIGRHEATYIGAAPGFRPGGSSGGLVSWVAAELLRRGMVDAVAHVVPADPDTGAFFRYRLSRSEAEVRAGAKSRYYPIELSAVLTEIRAIPGRYAVIGIPCFVKAVHLLAREDPVLGERITHTLGLFCGHMKSARLVESFAWQMGVPPTEIAAVDYRLKDAARPANWYAAHLALRDGRTVTRDWWHLADGDWGAGFFQSPACDACNDVTAETADISFGDAWIEPHASDGRGTNVVVVRSPELAAIVAEGMAAGALDLVATDAATVILTQAAGLRHRREGLAYRLTWRRSGLRPRKRVAPGSAGLTVRRRLVYRSRYLIARWSHRMFRLARATRLPIVYTGWARAALAVYAGLAWSRGWIGRIADRLDRAAR